MAKQKRNKKFNLGSFVKDLRNAIMKRAINFLVIAVFLAIAFLLVKAYLYRSDYFRLRRVEVRETFLDQKSMLMIKARILNEYKDKNIFSLDLKAIAKSLQSTYQDAKDVSVTIAPPDKLSIGLKLRKPVALIKTDKIYPVDEDGVIIPVSDSSVLDRVPSVEGVKIGYEDRRTRVVRSKNLKTAIDLLRNIKDFKVIADYGIDKVDARDLNNISFYLKNGVEVRVGGDNFRERLLVLAKTLRDPRLMMDRIKYVDLRFGDAVIGPR